MSADDKSPKTNEAVEETAKSPTNNKEVADAEKSKAIVVSKEDKVEAADSDDESDRQPSLVMVNVGQMDYYGHICGVVDDETVKVELKGLFGQDFSLDVKISQIKQPRCLPSYRNLYLPDFKPTTDKEVVEALRAVSAERLEMQKELDNKINLMVADFEKRWAPLDDKKNVLLAKHSSMFKDPFWLTVLKKSSLKDQIEEYDEPVLKHLIDVKSEWLDPSGDTGFKVTLVFEENQYFSNTAISKTYHTEQESDWVDSQNVTKVESDEIQWNAGQNVTVEAGKKRKGGGAKKKKVGKDVPRPSFFRTFFRNLSHEGGVPWTDPDVEQEVGEMGGEDEADEAEMMSMLLQMDYEKGTEFREAIIPHAIRWYTGEMEASDDEGDDSDDDDDSDDSDSEDEPKSKGKAKAFAKAGAKAGGKAQGGEGGEGEEKPECKQQ